MEKALELAKKGRGKVNPNPLVGAIIVKNNKIIGCGYHKKIGGPHAEIEAINSCNESIEGSTLYVTLEPCFHYGKTPPCVDKIIECKFSKVVIGSLDKNPLVYKKSIDKLERYGIEVKSKVLEEKCNKLNEVFMKYIETKEPFVVLKSAITLDGKIATSNGESKWITDDESRKIVHKLRNELTGIMIGVNTVIVDNPSLTCSIEGGRNPIRIIVDSKLRIPINSKIVKTAKEVKTIVATTKDCDLMKKSQLENLGVEVLIVNDLNEKVNLKILMKELGKKNIDSILLEGGGELNFSALEAGVVNKLMIFMAPKILGGRNSKTFIEGNGIKSLKDSYKISNLVIRHLKNDILITGYIER